MGVPRNGKQALLFLKKKQQKNFYFLWGMGVISVAPYVSRPLPATGGAATDKGKSFLGPAARGKASKKPPLSFAFFPALGVPRSIR